MNSILCKFAILEHLKLELWCNIEEGIETDERGDRKSDNLLLAVGVGIHKIGVPLKSFQIIRDVDFEHIGQKMLEYFDRPSLPVRNTLPRKRASHITCSCSETGWYNGVIYNYEKMPFYPV